MIKQRTTRIAVSIVGLLAVVFVVDAQHATTTDEQQGKQAPQPAELIKREPPPAQWLDRLPRDDRALLDEIIGYAPPVQTDALTWVGGEPLPWDELRGRVVVIQSWTSRTAAGRTLPDRLREVESAINSDDVTFIALHTPEGADKAATYLENRPSPVPVVIDPVGRFCDELGVYRRPVNIILDRAGTVRYAGLRHAAIADAVTQLLDEPWDEAARPVDRPKRDYAGPATFPNFDNAIRHANDFRGRRAPEFNVEHWITDRPNATDKVVVIDFWATWCGWCIHYLPHTNTLADGFRKDVVFVGLSDETPERFTAGMQRLKQSKDLTVESFHYPLALDSKARIKKAVNITGIPHMLVMSSDWVVRWQGHPKDLDQNTLGRIVLANRELVGTAGPNRYRWSEDAAAD